jgi:hypothetical protein
MTYTYFDSSGLKPDGEGILVVVPPLGGSGKPYEAGDDRQYRTDRRSGLDYSSNGPSDREEFATTSPLEVAIAIAAKSGFKRPRTASGMATPL